MSERQLALYGTPGCHLCEIAEQLLAQCLDSKKVQVALVDIAESDELTELYGIKIPVLKCLETQAQLCWPFDAEAVKAF